MKRSLLLLLAVLLPSSCRHGGHWTSREVLLINSQHIMRVLTVENPEDSLFLRRKADIIPHKDLTGPVYTRLVQGMLATVTSPEQNGVGIAGPQVGISRRIVAVQRFDKPDTLFEVYPNIRITACRGPKVAGREGCLSVPGRRGQVLRYQDIDIRYTSPRTLKDTTEHVQGFTAVIFQHECDHLDGIIYTDKLLDE